jgi:hypothetical protein
MGRSYDRNEYGAKNKVQVKVNGKPVQRQFRNRGEALDYVYDMGYTKDDIKRGIVKISG